MEAVDKVEETPNKGSSEESVLKANVQASDLNGETVNDVEKMDCTDDASMKPCEDAAKSDEASEETRAEIPNTKKRKLSEQKSGDESTVEQELKEMPELLEANVNKTENTQQQPPSDLDIIPKQTLGKGKRARIPNKRYSDILISPPTTNRSKSHVENGEKSKTQVDNESTDIKDDDLIKSRSNTSSPAPKKAKIADISNPNYRKPFALGWKRELVYRAATTNAIKRDGDIYYYTPAGKKLRSIREVSENLKNTDLTMENFTFLKEPIGLNDPEKEIIRDAKAWNRRISEKGGTKTPKVLSPKVESPRATPKRVASKVTSPKQTKAEVETVPSPRLRTSARNLGNIKVKLPPSKAKVDKKAKGADDNAELEPPVPVRRAPTRKAPKVTGNLEMDHKPCQPCSIRCQGVLGMVPTLQCRLCLCLYHYECVGLSPHVQVQGYICKNCQLEHGHTASTSPTICLPPLTPINTLKSITGQSSALPLPLKSQKVPGDSPEQESETANLPRFNKSQTNEPKSLVGSVTSWLPHSSTIQVTQKNKENEPIITAPRPQYVEYLGGRKFLIIPKHNVVSISPTAVANKPPRPINENISGVQADVKNERNSPNNVEAVQQSNSAILPNELAIGNGQDNHADKDDLESVVPQRAKRRTTKSNSTTGSEKQEEAKFMDNYLQNLSYGYNTLLYVFQYLKVQDLLRAGCVCTMWRDIASHSSLWKTVRMKNSQVHSFEGLANTLKRHGTVHLDLRKMLLPTNGGDDIWPEFSKAIEKVQTLRKIELCRCPSSVVEQMATTNTDLEVVNAVTIKCETMCLDRLSSLNNLKELRLKSTNGLTFSSDITALAGLTNLAHLSLTSIKDLNKLDLKVIAALTKLESLDLGECTDFPSTFGGEILAKLVKLEKLRLEKGQCVCHTFEILDAVKNMPQLEQLELVNFDIKTGFDVALGSCSNIKKLLIIPTYISQSATTNHMVLGGVLRLQSTLSHFVWGVTLELLRVTELFVDQCEDPDKKDKKDKKPAGNGDSIPVLKPVPLIADNGDDIPPAHDPPQVEILPLPNLQKLLLQSLPTTRVKILKIPFHATWRQSITDTVN